MIDDKIDRQFQCYMACLIHGMLDRGLEQNRQHIKDIIDSEVVAVSEDFSRQILPILSKLLDNTANLHNPELTNIRIGVHMIKSILNLET